MRRTREASFINNYLTSAGIMCLCLIAFAILSAFILMKTENPIALISIGGCLTIAASAIGGAILARIAARSSTPKARIIAGATIAIVLMISGLIMGGGGISAMAFFNYGLYFVLTTAVSLMPVGKRRRR